MFVAEAGFPETQCVDSVAAETFAISCNATSASVVQRSAADPDAKKVRLVVAVEHVVNVWVECPVVSILAQVLDTLQTRRHAADAIPGVSSV